MKNSLTLLCASLVLICALRSPAAGYRARVAVNEPTRINWTFALANRSLAAPPADWLGDYDSKQQQYELFVPPRRTSKKPLPTILFISPIKQPFGWKYFENLCKRQGVLFAAPHGAGNDCPPKKRVRIVLDVLDELRRHYPLDPDHTYLAGFSGGGRIACAIAFALPEYFGGVMPICASGELRQESWLRQRVVDRLSVALLTGEKDFNRCEVERLRGPMLKGVGVATRVWVQPGMGHAIPSDKVLLEAFRWLEQRAEQRRKEGQRYPASRLPSTTAPSREEQAKGLFAEAKNRLQQGKTLYSGLMQLKGCMERWPDLPIGAEAKKILLQYESRQERPWEADDLAEQRRFLLARARAVDAYACGDLPPRYAKERPKAVRQALQLWRKILADNADAAIGREAKKRIAELEKLDKPEK